MNAHPRLRCVGRYALRLTLASPEYIHSRPIGYGRPTLYGAVAGGLPGVKKVIDIFRAEIDLVMGQIGWPSLSELGPDFLWREDWRQNR